MEITIRLSEFNSPEVIVINPELTAQETIQVIHQKFNLSDFGQTRLIVAPTSKKNGSIVAPNTVLRNLMFNPKQDILELWRVPQFMNVAIYFKESGQDIIRDRKRIPVDYGIPLFKMIPTMQRAFELSTDQEFSFQYAEIVDDSGKVENNRWLNIQLSLEEQETRNEGYLLCYPTAKLVKTPEASLQVPEKAWLNKRSVKKDHTTNKQKRLFVLHEGFLFYYKKERDGSAAGVIPLEYYVIVKGEKKKKHNIFLNLSKDVLPSTSSLTSSYKLQFETPELLDNWYEKIKKRCVNNNSKKIFGIDLKEVIMRKSNPSKFLPSIVQECIAQVDEKGIDQEGIFRLSASALTIVHYKEKYDSGEIVDFSKIVDIHVAAGLLKMYLRELPEPLFTFDLYDKYTSLAGEDLPHKLAEVLAELPLVNYATIKYLIMFLAKVASRDEQNKMGPQNLATVFGPNLIRHSVGDHVQDFSIINKIIETLILKSEEIFHNTEALNSTFVQCPRFGASNLGSSGSLAGSGSLSNSGSLAQVIPNQPHPIHQMLQNPNNRGRRLKGPTVGNRPVSNNEDSPKEVPQVHPPPPNPNAHLAKPPPPNPRGIPRKIGSSTDGSPSNNNNNNQNSPHTPHSNPAPPPLVPRDKGPAGKMENVNKPPPGPGIGGHVGPGGPPVGPPGKIDELSRELEEERRARKKLEADLAALLSRISALEQKLGVN